MFHQLLIRMEKNRTKKFVVNIQAWYKTCSLLTKTYGDALYDQYALDEDIGLTLEKTDRMLFQLSAYTSDALGLLRHKEPTLAKKVNNLSTKVYRLRNGTTSFLLRTHGSLIINSTEGRQERTGSQAYYRALDEIGFTTRRLQRDLEKELKEIWAELQGPILTAEQSLAA